MYVSIHYAGYYFAVDSIYDNTGDLSHGWERGQQCNNDAQTMVVPDVAPPQSAFVTPDDLGFLLVDKHWIQQVSNEKPSLRKSSLLRQ